GIQSCRRTQCSKDSRCWRSWIRRSPTRSTDPREQTVCSVPDLMSLWWCWLGPFGRPGSPGDRQTAPQLLAAEGLAFSSPFIELTRLQPVFRSDIRLDRRYPAATWISSEAPLSYDQ